MSRTFVACFCANPASEFHWKEYGPYCLRFETDRNREPLLRVSVSGAQVGYYRAVYGEAAQQNAVEEQGNRRGDQEKYLRYARWTMGGFFSCAKCFRVVT